MSDEVVSPYLTTAEVAAHFRVSVPTIRNWIKKGKIDAEDINEGYGRPNYRIPVEAIQQKISRRVVVPDDMIKFV